MSTTNEQAGVLWKQILGFPSTNKDSKFFNENEPFNNYVIGGDIFLDDIPKNPIFDDLPSNIESLSTLPSNIIKHRVDGTSVYGVKDSSFNMVAKYENVKLQFIQHSASDLTSGAWNCVDNSNNNILMDSLQFNTNKDGSSLPYLYKLFLGTTELVPDNGKWVFDVKSGIIKFFNSYTGINQNTTNLNLTFYKYIGRKGINALSSNKIYYEMSNGGTNVIKTDASGASVDISGAKALNVDLSKNVVITSEVSALNVDLSGVSVDISGARALNVDLSGNVVVTSGVSALNVDASGVSVDISGARALNVDLSKNVVVTSGVSALNVDASGVSVDISGARALNVDLSKNVVVTSGVSALNVDASGVSVDISGARALNVDLSKNVVVSSQISTLNVDASGVSVDISGARALNVDLSKNVVVTSGVSALNVDASGASVDISGSRALNVDLSKNVVVSSGVSALNVDASGASVDISGARAVNVDLSRNVVVTSGVSALNVDASGASVDISGARAVNVDLSRNVVVSSQVSTLNVDASGASVDISGARAVNVDLSRNVVVSSQVSTLNVDASGASVDISGARALNVDLSRNVVVTSQVSTLNVDASGASVDISGARALNVDLSRNVVVTSQVSTLNVDASGASVDISGARALNVDLSRNVVVSSQVSTLNVDTSGASVDISGARAVNVDLSRNVVVSSQVSTLNVDASGASIDISGARALNVDLSRNVVVSSQVSTLNVDASGASVDISGARALNVDLSRNVSIFNQPISDKHAVNKQFLDSRMNEVVKNKDLFGQPPAIINLSSSASVNSIILSWENPIQFQTALDGGQFNNISNDGYNDPSLYIPVIKNIIVEYKRSDQPWTTSTKMIVTQTEHLDSTPYQNVEYYDVTTSERVNESSVSTMRHNLVNQLVMFISGDAVVKDQEGQELNFKNQYDDIIKFNATSPNKTYYCNPTSSSKNGYNLLSNNEYDFKVYCKNNLRDISYNQVYINNVKTTEVNPPTPIKTADFNKNNGFHAEFTRNTTTGLSLNQIKIRIPVRDLIRPGEESALDASGVKAGSINDSAGNEVTSFVPYEHNVFWKDFKIKAYHASAISNSDTDNSGIVWTPFTTSEYSGITLVGNNITNYNNIITYSQPSNTPSNITILLEYDIKDKFFKFEVEARNTINQTANGWSDASAPYFLRYGRPAQPPTPSITLVPQTNSISYQMKFDWTWPIGYKTSISDGISITDRNSQDTHSVIDLKDYEFVISASSIITVTVDENDKFVFNNDISATPIFKAGDIYIFDQSDLSNENHPLRFSQSDSSLNEYNSDASGVPGTAGAIMTFTPDTDTTVYVYSQDNIDMGSHYNKTTTSQTTSVHGVSVNSPNTENITVTVVNDGGHNKFVFNGDSANTPDFRAGVSYVFDQSDSTNTGHPLRFSLSNSSLTPYNSTASSTAPGNSGATVTFTPDISTTVYAYCIPHGVNMGSYYNEISISEKTSEPIRVTVVNDGGDNKFVFNPIPTFTAGVNYVFNQSDPSNDGHPLRFSQSGSSPNEYNSDASGVPGTAGAIMTFTPDISGTVYAYCIQHGIDMGSYYNTTISQITSSGGISINTNTSGVYGERIQTATENSLDATPITETISNNGYYLIPVTDEDKGFAYKVKFRVRNSVFSSGQDGGWSDYSENSNVLEPNPPNKVTDTDMNIKFFEDGTSDRVTYSWAHPSSKGGANINIRGYELEYYTSDTQTYPVAVDIGRSDRNPDTARNHVYNAADMRDHPFKFRVRARNFFKTGEWIDYHEIDPVAVPNVPRIFTSGTNSNSFEIANTSIVFKCKEPEFTVRGGPDSGFTNHNNNNFSSRRAVSVIDARLNIDASGGNSLITNFDVSFNNTSNLLQTFTFSMPNDSKLEALTDLSSKYTVRFNCKNVLNSNYSEQSSFDIQYAKPNPSNFSNAALFEYKPNNHYIKLTLRRSNAGLNTSGTILPITVTGSTNISNDVNKLDWQVKSNVDLSGVSTSYQSYGLIDTDYVVNNIGQLTRDQLYTLTYRCKNRYHSDFYTTDGECQIQMKKPNAPEVTSAIITIVKNTDSSAKNKIAITWNKPTEPGLFTKHHTQSSLTANSSYPNIYQYRLYIEETNNSDVSYNIIINTENDTTKNASNSFTLESSDNFPILPDTEYRAGISAYNQYYRLVEGDKSGMSNVSGGRSVPKQINGANAQLTGSRRPHISDIGGAYTHAGTSNFRILNDFTNPISMNQPNYNDRHFIRNLNTISVNSTNIFPVLLNFKMNKPADSSGTLQFDFKITGSSINDIVTTSQTIASDSSAGVYALVDGSNNTYVNVNVGSITDIYQAHRDDNKKQWYQIASLNYNLSRNTLLNNFDIRGNKLSMQTKFTYLGTSPTEITSDINDLYFDVIAADARPTADISSVVYTSPYTVLGVPMLRTGQSHDINVKLEISNRSQFYVMNNCATLYLGTTNNETYLPKHTLNFGNELEAAADWPTHRKMQTKNSGIDMVSASNAIKDVNNYSKDIKVRLTAQNIAGTMSTITSVEKFIYDGPTHDVLQNLGSPSTYTVQATSAGAAIPVTRLAILQMPNDFDPLQNTNVSNVSMNVNNTTSNRALLYRGYFQSPETFRNESSKGFGTGDRSNYHSSLATLYDGYTNTYDSTKYFINDTSEGFPDHNNSSVTLETHTNLTYFKDYYKWQIYKYTWRNSSSNGATISKFKIRLGNNDNTNISWDDLHSSEPRKGAACEIWVKTVRGTSIVSNWVKLTYGTQKYGTGGTNIHTASNFYSLSANATYATVGMVSQEFGTDRELVIGFHGGTTTVNGGDEITHYIAVGLRNDQIDKYIRNVYTSNKYIS